MLEPIVTREGENVFMDFVCGSSIGDCLLQMMCEADSKKIVKAKMNGLLVIVDGRDEKPGIQE